MTLAVAFPLASCGPSTGSGEPLRLAARNANLTTPCRTPAKLPDRDLNLQEVATYWGSDRKALSECAERHRALVLVDTAERHALQE